MVIMRIYIFKSMLIFIHSSCLRYLRLLIIRIKIIPDFLVYRYKNNVWSQHKIKKKREQINYHRNLQWKFKVRLNETVNGKVQ